MTFPQLRLDSTPCLRSPSLHRAPAPTATGMSSSLSSSPPSPPCSSPSLPSSSFSAISTAPFTRPLPRPHPPPPPRCPLRLLPPLLLHPRPPLRHHFLRPLPSLGRGASVVVFRGILLNGKSVAVKRLDHPSSSSPLSSPPQTSFDREFHNELHVLAALPPSPFVVSLLGYCLDSPHCRLLVYEYMPNGSLQDALFSSSDHHLVLSWDRQFSIVLDVAQALAFLSWDRRLGSGLGARLARQATQTGMM